MENYDTRVLDVAMGAGRILLQSGAEIFRVEETIQRISIHYGVNAQSAFVLSSGIFLTGEDQMGQMYANVKHIPLHATQLSKVDAVNRLSRDIEQGLSLEEAEERLRFIETMPGKKSRTIILASGVGAGCFCYILGGSLLDCFAAFLSGCILAIFQELLERRKQQTSKLIKNLLGAFLATGCALMFYCLGLGDDYKAITIGAIMPMLPGVSFMTSIRDLTDGDYIAGTVRLIDTLLVTGGIAMGVGLFYLLLSRLVGGFVL